MRGKVLGKPFGGRSEAGNVICRSYFGQRMEKIHIDLWISGRVQGVWYRKSAAEEAVRLGVTGFAMNLPDGSVRIEAEGLREVLDLFVQWCRVGPPRAIVENVDVKEGPLSCYARFETRW
jgi:acylphosphatase